MLPIRLIAGLFRFGITLMFLGSLAQITMDLCSESAKMHSRGIFSLAKWNQKLLKK